MPLSEIILMENPHRGWYGSPYQHRTAAKTGWAHRSKKSMINPLAMPKTLKGFYQGVSVTDAVAALAGFGLTVYLPSLLIKDVDTTAKKVGKVILAFVSAGVAGLAAKSLSPTAGKAAIAGGMAAALAHALSAFAGVQIGGVGGVQRMLGPVRRPIGRPVYESPMTSENSIITNVT